MKTVLQSNDEHLLKKILIYSPNHNLLFKNVEIFKLYWVFRVNFDSDPNSNPNLFGFGSKRSRIRIRIGLKNRIRIRIRKFFSDPQHWLHGHSTSQAIFMQSQGKLPAVNDMHSCNFLFFCVNVVTKTGSHDSLL